MGKEVQITDVETVTTIGSYLGLFVAFILGVGKVIRKPKSEQRQSAQTSECKNCSKEQEMDSFAKELASVSERLDGFIETVARQGEHIGQMREDMGYIRGVIEATLGNKVRTK